MTDRPVMLIAGGSGSIGRAIAREALDQGWAVALHGRNPEKLRKIEADLGRPETVEAFAQDISGKDAAVALVTDVTERFGRIDAAIDCVASGVPGITGLFPDTAPDCYTDFYAVSAVWLQRLTHAAYPHLAERGGTVISFISDAGIFAAPRQTIVGAARGACIAFIRNLSREAARDGIRAHVISPSYVEGSDIAAHIGPERMATAARRAGLGLPSAEDIAPLAVFLCSDRASKMTGQILSVNGGLNA